MKKVPQQLDDKLLDYLDGNLSNAERQSIDTLLNQDEDLAARLKELKAMNVLMDGRKLMTPSVNFTARVMKGLDQVSSQKFPSIKNGLWLLAGVLVTIIIAAALLSTGTFDSSTTTIDLNRYNLPKKYIDTTLPSFMLDGKILVNIIIVLNLAIVFVVLDRAILKPYFQRRMETGS